jgi:hypothetical protein
MWSALLESAPLPNHSFISNSISIVMSTQDLQIPTKLLTLKTATAMFPETLEKQHSMQHISKSQSHIQPD